MVRRTIVEEAPADGRGTEAREPRRRVLTLAEQVYRANTINVDEWQAAGQLRNLYHMLEPPSEGVSSYGQSPGGASPVGKADRVARRLTGLEIGPDGRIVRAPNGSRNNRSDHWRYADAVFAMCGLDDEERNQQFDRQKVDIMLRAVIEVNDTLTLTDIGRMRSNYTGEKQLAAAGGMFVKDCLNRLARHFGYIKG